MTQNELNHNLIVYIEARDLFNVIRMVELGADVNIRKKHSDYNALILSLHNYDFGIIQYLIYKGADPIETDLYNKKSFLEHVITIPRGIEIYDLIKWLKTYDVQYHMIEKYPKCLYILNKYDYLAYGIKEKYKHLLTASELNLL